jgi:hypothetical protein
MESLSSGRGARLALLLSIVGCSGVAAQQPPDAAPAGPPPYVGVWRAVGGELFGGGSGSAQVQYLELTVEGTGAMRTAYEPYGILGCGLELFHVDLGGLVTIDFGQGGTRLLRYETPDANNLVLSDQLGRELTFERVAEVPESSKCRTVTPVSTTTDIRPSAGYWSGLAYQSASSIWYTNDNGTMQSVNPSTGVVTAPNANTSGYDYIQTFDGANYWAHCACGGNETMQLLAPGGAAPVETLNTTTLGAEINIYGVASEGSTLWVSGYSYDTSSFRILKVTGATNARTLADSFEFAQVNGIAALNGKLWMIANATLVEVDPVAKKATATYTLPTTAEWSDLSAGGGSLWIFGSEPDGDGQLLRINP